MEIQAILDKYSPETFNSLNIENNILDIEKELIFEKEHQIPSLITSSKRPFDKNICYYDLPLVKTIKENIIPKNKYKLKYEQEIKPLDIDSIFNEKNDILKESSDNELRNKKIEIIKNNQYKEYIPKIKLNLTLEQVYSQEKNNKWYLLSDKEKMGPFNDFNLYKKIRDIYFDCIQHKRQIPYYLIKEEKGEIYLTMEECFQRLNKKFSKEIQKNIKNSGYGNVVFYPQTNFPYYFHPSNNVIMNNNYIPPQNNSINIIKEKEEAKQEIKEIDTEEFFNSK
jgi:hypothetical protein